MIKMQELRSKSLEELLELMYSLRHSLLLMRMNKFYLDKTKLSDISKKKKMIARIMTLINDKKSGLKCQKKL